MQFFVGIGALLLFVSGLDKLDNQDGGPYTVGYIELGLAVVLGVALLFAEVLDNHLQQKRKDERNRQTAP